MPLICRASMRPGPAASNHNRFKPHQGIVSLATIGTCLSIKMASGVIRQR